MSPTGEPASPARENRAPRWLALLAFGLLLAILTVVGFALLGERLFEIQFNP